MDACAGTIGHGSVLLLSVAVGVAILAILCVMSADASDAESGRAGDNVNWDFNSSTGTIRISGTGPMWDFQQGGTYGLPGWRNLTVKTVAVSEGVTTVGTQSFMNQPVTKVTLPSSLVEIHEYAFTNTKIANVSLPAGLKTIGGYAFCSTSLTSITLPDGIKSIGEAAFAETNISGLTIPASLGSLGQQCFRNTKIADLTIPSTLKSVAISAFSSTPIMQLTLEEGVKAIEDGAFSNTNISSLVLPDSLESIGQYAFGSCRFLRAVTMGAGMTTLSGGIFNDCTSLQIFQLGPNVTTLGRCLFSGCSALTEFFMTAKVSTLLTDPDGAPGNAFTNTKIANIIVDPANKYFESQDGILFTKSMGTLVAYPPGRTQSSYEIPEAVFALDDYAFLGSKFESLTIPNSVVSIGKHCINVDILVIPDSVGFIGDKGVAARELTIGDGITEIYATMIGGVNLEKLTLGARVGTIGEDMKGLSNLREVEITNRNKVLTSIGGIVYDKNVRSIVLIPAAMTGTYVMPNTVEYVSAECFCATKFTHIFLSENLKAIGGAAFKNNMYIKSITIPPKVMSIGGEAFSGCRNLEMVYFETSIKPAMGYRTFYLGDVDNWGHLRVYSTLPDGFMDRYAGKYTKIEYYDSEGGEAGFLEETLTNPIYLISIVLVISAALVLGERYISKRRL